MLWQKINSVNGIIVSVTNIHQFFDTELEKNGFQNF